MKGKYRILLVEDSVEDAKLTRLAFAKANIPVIIDVVQDGEECFKFLKKKAPYDSAIEPDLILLDLNMPKVNGIQVLEKIKVDEKLKGIPVLVLTTSKDDKDVLESYQKFANSYMTKPMDFNEFLDLVKEIEKFWLKIVKLPRSTD